MTRSIDESDGGPTPGTGNPVAESTRAFLRDRQLDLASLAALVPVGSDECALLGGSVAEGLANAESDIDVLVVGAGRAGPSLTLRDADVDVSTIMVGDATEVGVEVVSPDHLRDLGRRVAELCTCLDAPESVDRIDLITEGSDQKILHRIRTGVPLHNADVLERWRTELRSDRLPELMAAMRLLRHFSYREDAISHANDHDLDSASWCLSEAAIHMAGGALASIGETHYNNRWILSLLRRHRDALGDDVADGLTSAILDRLTSTNRLTEAVALFDGVLGQILERMPVLLPAYLRMTADFPLTTHIAAAGDQ